MTEKTTTVHVRALEHAASILGGKEKLRAYLHVPMATLEAWLAGKPPPMDVFLKAVDAISAPSVRQADALKGSARDPLQASPEAATALLAFLDAAIEASRADMGNLQLAGPDGLRIVAQRGFEQRFLDFFAAVSDEHSACARALKAGRRVVVPDVETSEIFGDTPAKAAMQTAGARAVQSTPIVAASGWILGVISTHYRKPHEPTSEELAKVDDIARRAADWLATAPR
ncbi:MAG TPA: GAF domain-containing protein [Burkholderiales bacterium]|nr:GAF domain-containing protein [Burkholderiales bacterium]